MIHLLFDRNPWFRPKTYGYGAGLPIAWQGWFLLAMHVLLIVGLSILLAGRPTAQFIAIFVAAIAPLPIYAARTEGGWRWRWGNKGDRK